MRHEPFSGSHGKPSERDPALTDWLIARGFPPDDLEAVIENRATPLIHACRLGDRTAVNALIEAGASLDAVNADGNNALWLACFNEELDIIARLVSSGIAIDHRNDSGTTCLMYAASSGRTAVVARLLQAGAETALRNQDDFTALDLAANLECLQLLRSATVSVLK